MPRSLWITPSWLTRIFDKDRKDRGQNKALLNNAATIWRPTLPKAGPRMVDSQVAGMADRNDRYSVQRRVGFKTTGCFVTVEPRQLDIHKNEIRPMRCRRGKCRLAVHGFDHFKIGAHEQISQDLSIVLLILDDQDTLAHPCTACPSTPTGTVK